MQALTNSVVGARRQSRVVTGGHGWRESTLEFRRYFRSRVGHGWSRVIRSRVVTGGHGWSRVAREYFRIPTIFPVTGWSRVVTA